MWLFPWASYAAIAGMVTVLAAMAFTKSMTTDLYASLGTLVIAFAAYFLVKALRGAAVGSPAA